MGGKYYRYFKFEEPYSCGGPVTDVIVSNKICLYVKICSFFAYFYFQLFQRKA